jgi:hypothetical protein
LKENNNNIKLEASGTTADRFEKMLNAYSKKLHLKQWQIA